MENPNCQKLKYLIGVPAKFINGYDDLNKGILKTIRYLCSLRSEIIEHFSEINSLFREKVQLSEINHTAYFVHKLAKHDIIIENNHSLSRNVIELNEIIAEKIKPISLGFYPLFDEWVQELLNMPDGDTVDGVKKAVRKYRQYKNYYPFQKYINWPFEATPEETRSQNILRNDELLHKLLAELHRPKFINLMDFVGVAGDAVIIVDCENSDAQRLYDALAVVKLFARKIILIDDTHTNRMWDEIVREYKEADITIEHDEFPRLKEEKSLVDHRMVAKACEEFYKNNIKHFVLVTSDSDIWALIHSLPDAEILVLAERCKSGDVFIDALTQNKTQRVFLEDITSESTELQDRIMYKTITEKLATARAPEIDFKRLVINAAGVLNLYLDDGTVSRYIQWAQDEVKKQEAETNE